MELGIIAYQIMSKILRATIRIGRRSDTPYIKVDFIAASNSRYYIYAANLSQIPIPSYCLRVYI